jgi:hypothetical protein
VDALHNLVLSYGFTRLPGRALDVEVPKLAVRHTEVLGEHRGASGFLHSLRLNRTLPASAGVHIGPLRLIERWRTEALRFVDSSRRSLCSLSAFVLNGGRPIR